MKQWIENRKILAALSDPAGAKAILAFLSLYGACASKVTVISDREYSFFKGFDNEVLRAGAKSAAEWLVDTEVLIAGTSYPARLEFDLIDLATRAGITSISFVDHWTNIAARFERNGRSVLPDVIGVVDERARSLAQGEGLPAGKLRVIGNPYHEHLEGWRPKITRDELLASLGLSPHKPYILYAPEPFSRFGLKAKYGFDEIDGLNLIREARKALPDGAFYVVVKGHPNQDHQLFEMDIAKLPDRDIIYLTDGDLNTLSFHAAACVGFFSNALVEASLLGCPIVRPLILRRLGTSDPLRVPHEKYFDATSMKEFVDILRRRLWP